jgi:polysaccharide pyruvyl transferase WcaK-like protein
MLSALDVVIPSDYETYWGGSFSPRRLFYRLRKRGICPDFLRRPLRIPDAVLSIGGDNFSLDYGFPERFVSDGEHFRSYGVPFVIWGASVGPFQKEPQFEQKMRDFLGRVSLITVRESYSASYLASIGITNNVAQVWDPAFLLEAVPYDSPDVVKFLDAGNVVGFNVSHLAATASARAHDDIIKETVAFCLELLDRDFRVLLVPHVQYPDGVPDLKDEDYLDAIFRRLPADEARVKIIKPAPGARELKWMISRCRFFFGARTHATIAAVSSGVPTIAIAYSAKARSLWQDIFGHTEYLLETDKLTCEALMQKMQLLLSDENSIRKTLSDKHQEMLDGARRNALALKNLLERK